MKKLVGVLCIALALASCGYNRAYKFKRGLGDTPVGQQEVSKAYIVVVPHHYANVLTKCAGFGHFRLWETADTNNSDVAWINTDPECPGGRQPGQLDSAQLWNGGDVGTSSAP